MDAQTDRQTDGQIYIRRAQTEEQIQYIGIYMWVGDDENEDDDEDDD